MTREGKTWLKSLATAAFILGLAALASLTPERQIKQTLPQQPQITTQTATPDLVAEPTPAPAPTTADLKDYWKHFGVAGRNFRDTKPGEFGGGEGGLVSVKTFSNQMWSVDFEPLDRRDVPLDQRLVYMAQVSSDSSEKMLCGAALPDFQTAPARCIVQEKIFTWKQTRSFFRGKIKDHKANFASIEIFLRKRGGKEIPDSLEAEAAKLK